MAEGGGIGPQCPGRALRFIKPLPGPPGRPPMCAPTTCARSITPAKFGGSGLPGYSHTAPVGSRCAVAVLILYIFSSPCLKHNARTKHECLVMSGNVSGGCLTLSHFVSFCGLIFLFKNASKSLVLNRFRPDPPTGVSFPVSTNLSIVLVVLPSAVAALALPTKARSARISGLGSRNWRGLFGSGNFAESALAFCSRNAFFFSSIWNSFCACASTRACCWFDRRS